MNKIIIATAALSAGLSFYLGYSFRNISINEDHSSINSASRDSDKKRQNTSTSISDEKATSRRINISSTKNRQPVNIVLADLKALLGDTGMMSMDISALAESYNLVKHLSEAELVEALNQLQGNLSHPSNMLPLMLILGKYAELNPLNAMEFYESKITSPQSKMVALSGILSSWSKSDPEGAYEWYQKKTEKGNNGGMMSASSIGLVYIFQGLAKKDLGSTIEKLKNLGASGFKAQMAASGIASSLRSKDDFIEFIEQTKDLKNDQIGNSVLGNWVLRNPSEAVEWIDSLESENEKKKYEKQILSSWMMTSPSEAADWYMSKSDDKQVSADHIIKSWSYRNPKAALNWVKSQDGLDSQKSIKAIFKSARFTNPGFVADNIDELSDTKAKKEVSLEVYRELKSQDKAKATEFLEKSPFKEDLLKQPESPKGEATIMELPFPG
jgi:hypothetical protein